MKITLPTEMSSIDETTTHTIKAVITWGDWVPQKILAIDADYRDTVACFCWESGRVLCLLTPLLAAMVPNNGHMKSSANFLVSQLASSSKALPLPTCCSHCGFGSQLLSSQLLYAMY